MNKQQAFFAISSKDLNKENTEILDKIHINPNISDDTFYSCFAILISIDDTNLQKFLRIKTSNDIFAQTFNQDLASLDLDIQKLFLYQTKALMHYKNTKKDYNKIIGFLEKLHTHNFITKAQTFSLQILLKENKKQTMSPQDKPNTAKTIFDKRQQNLHAIIEKIKASSTDEYFCTKLDEIALDLNSFTFSIGITGVMNAGKSTLLNALLQEEVLGTSVVPETANLTIIKQGEPRARVHFYTKSQWQAIINEGKINEDLKTFTQTTHNNLGDKLDKLLDTQIDIALNKLCSYTSAKDSHGISNVVRNVEMFYDANFLTNNVEIVDTPGIDDPITQREEITKKYLQKCDVLVHLMNGSQSTTKKDIDFLVDCLVYQNISKLIIVITKIDTISPQALNEVTLYTKNSIKKTLLDLGKKSINIDDVKFIAVSAKQALDESRTNSGVDELEKTLQDLLFSDTKTDLIIARSSSLVQKLIMQRIELIQKTMSLLDLDAQNAKEQILNQSKQNDEVRQKLYQLREKNAETLQNYKDFTQSLNGFFASELRYFYDRFLKRLVQNLSHAAKKGEALDAQTISFVANFGIKDGIIDIARQYGYELSKQLEPQFHDIFKDGFLTRFLGKNHQVLEDFIKKLSSKKIKDAKRLEDLISPFLKDYFQAIRQDLERSKDEFLAQLLDIVTKSYEAKIKQKLQEINKKEQSLIQATKQLDNPDDWINNLSIEVAKLKNHYNELGTNNEYI